MLWVLVILVFFAEGFVFFAFDYSDNILAMPDYYHQRYYYSGDEEGPEVVELPGFV